jgi:hypothetical protein
MSTEVKNTLMRFQTLRSPELSDEENKSLRFIEMQNLGNGNLFFDAVKAQSAITSKWKKMLAILPTSIPEPPVGGNLTLLNATLTAYNWVVDSNMVALSIWIAKNKNSITFAELDRKLSNSEGIAVFSPAQEKQLWNNLFYQVLTQKDFYQKEAIMQLLALNHIIKNRNSLVNDNLVKNILLAKVVLPAVLFDEKVDSSSNPAARLLNSSNAKVEADFVAVEPSQEMVRLQNLFSANSKLEKLQNLKNEFLTIRKSYQRDYNKAYSAENEYHQANVVKPIMDDYQNQLNSIEQQWCSNVNPSIPYDPKNPCSQPPKLPFPNIPKLEFYFRPEMDLVNLRQNLTSTSFETMLEVLGITVSENQTFRRNMGNTVEDFDPLSTDPDDFLTDLNGNIYHNTQVISTNTNPPTTTGGVSVGGFIIPTGNGAVPNSKFFDVTICPNNFESPKIGLTFEINIPDSSWTINLSNSFFTLNGPQNTTGGFVVLNQTGTTINVRTSISFLSSTALDATQLEGEIVFNGKKTMTFSIPTTFEASIFRSCYQTALKDKVLVIDPGTEPAVSPSQTVFIPSGFGVKQLGIADYKKVEQTTHGYVEGEVAHIENIMAREYKEKATRKLVKKEATNSKSSETEHEKLSDTTSTSRFEMQSEIARMTQESTDVAAAAGMQYQPVNQLTLSANVNAATHSSKEESNRQAVTQAKELTERALERIVSKVKEERIEKITEEFEENNKHGYDNSKGDKHIVGVYRWVDKVYKNQVINYGKRLMFEFMVPEPGRLHVLGMTDTESMGKVLIKPTDPRKYVDLPGVYTKLNLANYGLITESSAKYWGGIFNVELDPCPPQTIFIGKSFSNSTPETMNQEWEETAVGNHDLEIPKNYETFEARGIITVSDERGLSNSLIIGGKVVTDRSSFPVKKYTQKIPISYSSLGYHTVSVNVEVECNLQPGGLQEWQQKAFKTIIDAYEKALASYNEMLASEEAIGKKIKDDNPGFYRQIENIVLRKNCISYLIDQNPNAKFTYGKSLSNNVSTFGGYEVKLGQDLDNYAALVKFMEQAFEWNIMSYNFYPYYWGNRTNWQAMYQYDNNDPLFRNFMQAGMARVVVTVNPGFEEAVSWYMQTGQIWNGGEVPVIEDKLFMSIVDELRQPTGLKEGKAWPTRLPTSLTILQAETIGLTVTKALPFNDDLGDFENPNEVPKPTGFQITDSQLNGSAVSKHISFTYQGMDTNEYTSIGHFDREQIFPRKFSCMDQEFTIHRNAAWRETDSSGLIFEELAEQINLIPGITAKQFTAANGNTAGLKFIIDTNIVSRFSFTKYSTSGVEPRFDMINMYITDEAVRFTSPQSYLNRILDANGKQLVDRESDLLLPISRFLI